MYTLINQHIPRIMKIIGQRYVDDYDGLVEDLAQAGGMEYQKRYRVFWALNAARLSQGFCRAYFRQLQTYQEGHPPKLPRLVERLYQTPVNVTGTRALQFSFASKLVHMLNPHAPIYDRMISSFYFYNEPSRDLPLQQRIDGLMSFYRFLTNEYARVLKSGLLKPSIQAFRKQFNPKHFTDEKVIDGLIWAFVSLLRGGAQVNGRVVYR